MKTFRTVFYAACVATFLAGCGNGNNQASSGTTSYDTPSTLATSPANPAKFLMGGAVQGTPLVLSNSVSTWAGSVGLAGLLDGSGTAAKFYQPTEITTDGVKLYVADYANNAIRQIDTAGNVTTLSLTDKSSGAGIILNRPSSITSDGTNLYVVDSKNNAIRFIDATLKVETIGSITGLAGAVDSTIPADVRFNQPTGITTDGVNLYVTDSGNHTIRRIVISSKVVTTLAGAPGSPGSTNGAPAIARFNIPARITTDRTNLYVTDFLNRTVRKIDILTGTVSTLAGVAGISGSADTSTGVTATFNQPNGITTDGKNLYLTDSYNNTIRKIVIASQTVTTLAGIAGTKGSIDSPGISSFDTPIGMTTDGTSIYIADSGNQTIRKIQ